ncbi:hypothetical protein BDF19DRAFT_425669 [Syncephalis fuscata]|nr:hypothetical protein BDF19DRAFT_425669 [Syncephalis fuscata]
MEDRYVWCTESGYWYDRQTNIWLQYDRDTGECHSVSSAQQNSPWSEPTENDTIRLVVRESDVLQVGGVVIVDASGVIMARDRGPGHRLRLRELQVSKYHARIYYSSTESKKTDLQVDKPSNYAELDDSEEGEIPVESVLSKINSEDNDDVTAKSLSTGTSHLDTPSMTRSYCCPYWIVDCGSMHGTFINNERLSDSRKSSQPRRLNHSDCIQVGSTLFEVHIHDPYKGWGSCQVCVLRENNAISLQCNDANKSKEIATSATVNTLSKDRRTQTEQERRMEMQRIRHKYALHDRRHRKLNTTIVPKRP